MKLRSLFHCRRLTGRMTVVLTFLGNGCPAEVEALPPRRSPTFPNNPRLPSSPLYSPATARVWADMRWPPWSSESNNDDQNKESDSIFPRSAPITNNLSSYLDWEAFVEPRTLIPTVVLTSGILFGVRFHRRYLRRIPDAPSISPSFLRHRSIFGKVTSVGDGDNFRIFHTPGGRIAGWGWLPWKKVPTNKKDLKDNTVRLSPQCCSLGAVPANVSLEYRSTSVLPASMHPNSLTSVVQSNHSRAKPTPGSRSIFQPVAYAPLFTSKTSTAVSWQACL